MQKDNEQGERERRKGRRGSSTTPSPVGERSFRPSSNDKSGNSKDPYGLVDRDPRSLHSSPIPLFQTVSLPTLSPKLSPASLARKLEVPPQFLPSLLPPRNDPAGGLSSDPNGLEGLNDPIPRPTGEAGLPTCDIPPVVLPGDTALPARLLIADVPPPPPHPPPRDA